MGPFTWVLTTESGKAFLISLHHPATVALLQITRVCLRPATRLARMPERVLPEPTPLQLPSLLRVESTWAVLRCMRFGGVGASCSLPGALKAQPAGMGRFLAPLSSA